MANIAFLSTMERDPWGGSEELWSRCAMALRKTGHKIGASIAAQKGPRPEVERLAAAGIDIHVRKFIAPSRLHRLVCRLRGRRPKDPRRTRFIGWLKRTTPDLLCISQGGPFEGLPWMEACQGAGIPYAVLFQAHADWVWPPIRALQATTQAFQSAAAVFFVARRNRQLLEDQLGLELPNARVVWNPSSVGTGALQAWPSHETGWKLACVGRLEPAAKGQDLLLRALASEKWRSRPVRLRLYGTGGWEENLRRLTERLGLQYMIEFLGHKADVSGIWRNNHIMVLPSRYEGTPLALIEAAFCGRAAVVTDVAGNADVVLDGLTGFVAPAATAGFLDQALERAWHARDRWQQMGADARSRALEIIPHDPAADFAKELLGLTA